MGKYYQGSGDRECPNVNHAWKSEDAMSMHRNLFLPTVTGGIEYITEN